MATKKLIGKCPVCSGKLYISELSCSECDTKISGEFEIPPFSRLDDSEREFLMLFLRSRGSLRDVQRELTLSYPTVRNRLDALLAKMGIVTARASQEEINEVLDRLESGELSAEDAVNMIRGQEASEDEDIEDRHRASRQAQAHAREEERQARAHNDQARELEAEIRDKLRQIHRKEREIRDAEKDKNHD